MKDAGKTIRKIRLNKGYTQKEVYSDIVSKSYAIEFEKGKHEMTVSNFQKVLDYLRLDYDEFQFIHHDYQQDALPTRYQTYMNASNAGDVSALNKLLKEVEHSRAEKDKLLHAQIVLTLARLASEQADETPNYPKKEIDFITRYLMAVDSWSLHEINLFANNLLYLPTETRTILMTSAMKNLDKYKNFHLYRNILAGLLVNFISRAMNEDDLSLSWYYLTKLEELSQETLSGWQRELSLFLHGLYKILTGEKEQGLKMCQHLLEYYELIGYSERTSELTDTLESCLKKVEKI